MKTNIKTLLYSLGAALLVSGCASTPIVKDAAYIQGKATRISQLVAGMALANNPQPELRVKLEKVVADLRLVTAGETVSVAQLADIAQTVPQVADSKYGFAIEMGQLVFEDELQRLAVKNPALLRAAGMGMADGIAAALAQSPAPAK